MKLISVLLMMLMATSVAAREPDFNLVGISHDLDRETTTVLAQKEFSERFFGQVSHTQYPGSTSHTTVGAIGMKWHVTDNLVPFVRASYLYGSLKIELPPGADDQFSQVSTSAGVKYGFGRIWQTGAVATYVDNDNYFGSYWNTVAYCEAYPWGEKLGLGLLGRHAGFNNEWTPSVYAIYHFGGEK